GPQLVSGGLLITSSASSKCMLSTDPPENPAPQNQPCLLKNGASWRTPRCVLGVPWGTALGPKNRSIAVPQLWLENEFRFLRLWRTQNIPSFFTAATTAGICSSASAKTALSDATAISRPLTLNGPTSTRDTIRDLILPVAGLH